jgi:phage major head subunit gpT-like protein
MPMNPIRPGPALDAAVKTAVVDGYESAMTDMAAVRALLQDTEASDKEKETYVYRESAPLPRRQDKGDGVPYGSTKYNDYEIINRRYTLGVQIHEDDLADDQTSLLQTEPARTGASYAQLQERIAFQMLLGQTDPALLPFISNAPDGSALFATGRFGVGDGNIVGSQAAFVSSAANARTAVYNGVLRRGAFLDTEGQPMVPPEGKRSIAVIVNQALEGVFREALKQELAAGLNIVGDFPERLVSALAGDRFSVELIPTTRVTSTTSFFLSFTHSAERALKRQPRDPMRVVPHTPTAGETFDDGYMRWKVTGRDGYGISLPTNLIRVQTASA